ncbi:NAD(P)/FAD-dependent oxidoreductase [Rubinisphaera sp.]|uniref:phytoene desaturase family protein n=1 Tax=Rubinisphaera sp. TaxID=2024857 RepID=UPI000C11EBE3|nr:NAD(P)/FAD-dependent oxidoreductase [Rubinisphaera sp.]MBV09541.1 phytoene dehydrogenase [Rubinisphaera sp.]
MHYETIIIGAGLSGLAAGIRLAYFDQSVCILERHTTIGGLNSFYRLRGRNHDVGLHAVTNFAKPGTKSGPLSKLLRQLRLSWDDFSLCEQNGSSVVFPGASLKFNNDFSLLESEVAESFPQQVDNFRRLHQFLLEFNELDLAQEAVSARKAVAEFITDPLLLDMLFCPLMFYGSARADDMDLNQFVVMYKSIFMEGFGRPFKGVRPIMKALVRKYKESGGILKLRAGVQEILLEGNRAVGVRLDDGTELTADRVLSSAGLAETSNLCKDQLPIEPSERQPGVVTFNEMIDVIDAEPADLGHDQTIIFFSETEEFHYQKPEEPCDLRSGIICSPNNFQYGEPLEEGIIRITALANHDYWLGLEEDEYRSAKQVWAEKIRETSLKYLPDYRSHILDTDSFTPRTIKRFTWHENGCVYGAPVKRLDGTTGVEQLYLCGTDQGFLGIIGSMLSGITMANNHCLMG